ncbi:MULTISPECIES: winged helix-turn-helix domain-containing protein [Actinomycetes]|uniref:OmpR/PhoB-type domain-containing protein n=2 Tax=Actinomycetes TaxID=1760 RepID=A0ABP6M271_9MICC|nr:MULTISPECIES: winged helix-turn-helix domain-containing protein [unclassified Nesterenkonia]MDS2173703.1 winged helix-turn-helix domain-containing protein [Nesterenkonia sp. CL21]OSM42027.1 transcriptional regulator [Nesterenkonia sp. PF2B19]
MSAHPSQAQNPGYVHVSVRNAARRAEIARRMRDGDDQQAGRRAGRGRSSSQPRTGPVPVVAQNGGGPQLVQPDVVARGFVVYVGLDEDTATAAGTSLHKIATDLRDYVESIAPESQVHIAMAMASAAAEGSDLDVVRQALGDPTVTHRTMEVPVAAPQAPSSSGVLIDLSRREVKLDGDNLNLTYKEFELLNYLVENGTRTVGREELLKALWRNADTEQMPNERTIDVHIRRLRSKLGRLANTVRTVRGQGYRFYEHPEVTVWAAPEYSI